LVPASPTRPMMAYISRRSRHYALIHFSRIVLILAAGL